MGKKDWDCAKDGHIPGEVQQQNSGLGRGTVRVRWCLACGKRMP